MIGSQRASQRAEGQRGADRRRNIEAALLAFALAICLFAYIDADLAMNNKMPPGLLVYGASFTVLVFGAHLVMRKYARYADPLILPCAVLLNGLGLVLLNRLDQSYAIIHSAKGDYQKLPAAPSQVQFLFISVPIAMAMIAFVKHHRFFQRYVYIVMVGGLVLLAAPAFFPGDDFGAKRWIKIPGLPQLEPDEFVKLAICVFFAGYLMMSRDALALVGRKVMGMSLPRMRNLGPVLAIWVISLLVLIFERDLGTSLIFFGVFIVMLYVATERTSWTILGLLMAVGGAAVVGSIEPHVHGRVVAWLHPLDYYKAHHDPALISNQPAEALFSFGTGHLTGTGLGSGRPWLISFAGRSDFIFTTVGEELGLAGVTAVLLVYGLFVQRGLKTAIALSDPFGKLLATGLASAVGLQVFVVVGGVSGLIPLTGKALPFLAAGGSSTLANWLLTGIMLKLSDAAGRNELEPQPESSGVIAPPKPTVAATPATPAAGTVPGQGEARDDDTMYLRATPREAAAPTAPAAPTPPPYGAPTVHGTANRSGAPGAPGAHGVPGMPGIPGTPGMPGTPDLPSTGTQPDTPTF
ncbi:FtsW/RodA/SpoVE family cell cycle protein [Kitasatospora acidiphila]|uniref:FtsW/RodA/SpoVE family cell cycle protein n=1 Tax=Kitasatospora acidiphila TaxID=2567942 RepID=UPI001E2E4819|nr:FtsW/RodA/SpoVE family cell cycle protein [Kitasatospora acidiphila]